MEFGRFCGRDFAKFSKLLSPYGIRAYVEVPRGPRHSAQGMVIVCGEMQGPPVLGTKEHGVTGVLISGGLWAHLNIMVVMGMVR